jgi:hypothetical protein
MKTPDISKLCRGLLAGDSLKTLDAEGPRKGESVAKVIGEKLCGMAMQGDLKALSLLMELAELKSGEKGANPAKAAPQTVIIQDYPS